MQSRELTPSKEAGRLKALSYIRRRRNYAHLRPRPGQVWGLMRKRCAEIESERCAVKFCVCDYKNGVGSVVFEVEKWNLELVVGCQRKLDTLIWVAAGEIIDHH